MASSSSDPDKLMSKADKLQNKIELHEMECRLEECYLLFNIPWDAAKHMESAGALAKELGRWNEVSDFYRRASEFYRECGRAQPASDALAKGASFLEDNTPDEAIKMYDEACSILEEDGKEQMAFDLYRAAASLYVKLEKYSDAAATFLRLGSAADKCNAINSQCKGYLSAIIIYLYAHDFQQAQKCYNDCSEVQAFLNSDQNRCAMKLLSAYEEGDAEGIKQAAQSSAIKHLDHVVIRLAKKLPTGDLQTIKKLADDDGEDSLDENDLT
uniref:Gamma-soluble NSF attachment protein n=1 Tax=Oryza rufipogon TaxID=4529 RepID=A0A0E0PE50_ORYRU